MQYDDKEWEHKCIVQNFSFDTKLNKVDFVFKEDQFENKAQIVKIKEFIINKVNITKHIYSQLCIKFLLDKLRIQVFYFPN